MRIRSLLAAMVVVLGSLACGTGTEADGLGTSQDALSANNPVATSNTVQLSTGVTLHYLAQGKADGTPVIFIPGYSDSWQTFSRNQNLPNSWRVYYIDQRGHGDSSKPASGYTQDDFTADVVAFMDALGIGQAVLVGHSMGSFTAHQVAAEHPSRVSKLVLIGSATTAVGHEPGIELAGYMSSITEVDPGFVEYFQRSTFFKNVPESYIQGMISQSLKVPLNVWQQAMDGLISEDHTAALANITAPTLILFGDQDSLFTLQHQVDLQAAIPGSTLKVYPNVGHGLHAESPSDFRKDLIDFIGR